MATQTVQEKGVLGEWRELESDPGLFSLLIEDYGVRGVKVEEIYDVSEKLEGMVYGFVFLFRWGGDRRARTIRKKSLATEDSYVIDSEIVNRMFFAHQVVNNSCATHALLSVLLNCNDVELGPCLTSLKEFSAGLDPESKGFAIGNIGELARAHNKHAKPSNVILPPPGGRRASVMSSAHALIPETYHFVSYVPINDRLFELDGLKEFPIDHGPWGEQETWTDLFQRIISQRLANAEDILFNLMAVVPDPVPRLSEQLRSLHVQQRELLDHVIQLVRESVQEEGGSSNAQEKEKTEGGVGGVEASKEEDSKDKDAKIPGILRDVAKELPREEDRVLELSRKEASDTQSADEKLRIAVARVVANDQELESCKLKLKEEIETKQRYRVEFSRRTHDYNPLITEFIKMLARYGQLPSRFMKRPSNAQPAKSVAGQKRSAPKQQQGNSQGKGEPQRSHKKAKTTLLVNGTEVG